MKRAWEYDYEFFCDAIPVRDRTDLIQWDNLLEGKFLEEARQMLETGKGAWIKPLPESKAPYSKMLGAISSMRNMGYDVQEADLLIPEAFKAIDEDRLIDLQIINARVFKALAEAPKIESHPYWSYTVYNSFEQYAQSVKFQEYPDYKLPGQEALFEKVHAGWLGEIIGSALGTAVEGFKSSRIWEVFGEITEYVKPPETLNDDITFELALLEAFREKGYDITSEDIADKWVGYIPFAYTAEEIALNHLRHGIYPPESGYVANPYREMIGAAMRAAICGALAPAMQVILDKAMRMIPRDSEFYSVLAFACQACGQSRDYRQAWELCEEKYKEYNWVHAYPNLAAEVVAIRFAGNSFERAMTILMMAGQDNDCTGGPIGHAYGVMLGLGALDDKFVAPLRDQLDTYVRTMESQSITSLSKKTTDAILKYN